MKRLYHALSWIALLSTTITVGCGPSTANLSPKASEDALEGMPKWMTSPPEDPSYLFAAATATSQDLQLAIDKAKAQAQTGLAQQFETKVGNLTKRFQEETGLQQGSTLLDQLSSATKLVTSQTLTGTQVKEQKIIPDRGIYRAYVLMSLPLGEANQALMGKIKANQELYTRFRATQAFEELDKELKALEPQGK